MNNKQRNTTAALILLIILENLFLYYFFRNGILTQGKNAIGLFLTSIFIGLIVIYKFYNELVEETSLPANGRRFSYAVTALLALALIILGTQYDHFFHLRPLSIESSDIIPSIQIMCKRLLAGKYPYDIFYDFGFPQMPTYLPMQWIPFSIAEILHIDYRWIPYTAWCIAAVWLCIRSAKASSPMLRAAMPLLIFASNYILFSSSNKGIVEASVELLISAYYMMFISGLNQKNGVLQGIIIAFCLLSRYSLVLWIPLYSFILFVSKNRKQLYFAFATTVLVVTILYIIPYLSKDTQLFYKCYKYYDDAARFEWTHLNKDNRPIQLYSGTGFGYYFYTRFTNLPVMDRVKLLQKTHLVCSILVTVILGTWYWFRKDKINTRIFLMSSFKIYLAVFLFLIQVPYEYLMCAGNFVSIAILCEQARYSIRRSSSIGVV